MKSPWIKAAAANFDPKIQKKMTMACSGPNSVWWYFLKLRLCISCLMKNFSLLKFLYAAMWKNDYICTVHNDALINHAMPWVEPKVKKASLLCIIIHMAFHPGEYGHDGWVLYPHHHYPYPLSLSIECKQPCHQHLTVTNLSLKGRKKMVARYLVQQLPSPGNPHSLHHYNDRSST